MYLTRNGYLEETFFTFSLSPIRDERGVIAGLFHPVTETTAQMLNERRTRALRELAAKTGEARSLETASSVCLKTLAAHQLICHSCCFHGSRSGSGVTSISKRSICSLRSGRPVFAVPQSTSTFPSK